MKMKKIISFVLAIAIFLTAIPATSLTASAETTSGTIGGFTWTLEGTELTISGSGTLGSYCLPSSVRTATKVIIQPGVTGIEDHAFSGCDSLIEISIPDSVVTIGSSAFMDCKSLTEITIPDNVSVIGDSAFSYCYSLTQIAIPDSVTSIGRSAFSYCYCLTEITVSENNLYYSSVDGVLFNKYKTVLIQCPAGKTIGNYIIPVSVESISDEAFSYCNNLSGVTIGSNVNSIGNFAFLDCLLNDVWYMGSENEKENISISVGNEALTSATWHYNICENGHTYSGNCDDYCDNCEWTREVGVDHNYDNTCDTTCNSCGNVRSVTHTFEWIIDQNNNCSIDGYKHEECIVCHIMQNENTVITATGNHAYDDEWDTICNVCQTERVVSDATSGYYTYRVSDGKAAITDCDVSISGEVTIPSTLGGYPVTTIEDSAFKNCKNIVGITIPDGVTSIGMEAFSDCESLGEVIVPNSVSYIGDGAFYCCYALKEITIPNGVTRVNGYTFFCCASLTKITIPNSVSYIGYRAFYCCPLTEITISSSVTNIENCAFEDSSNLIDVWYVGTEIERANLFIGTGNFCLDNAEWHFNTCPGEHIYENEWDEDCNNCEMQREVADAISGYYTYRMDSGKWTIIDCDTSISGNITIPSVFEEYPVTAIGDGAFENCANIVNISIPSSITNIGADIFDGCSSLERIEVSEDNPNYSSASGILYNKDKTEIICIPENHKLMFQVNYIYFTGETAFTSIVKYMKAGDAYSAEIPEIEWYSTKIDSISGTMPAEDLIIDVVYYENPKLNSGQCTDTMTWILYDDGSLIFSGTGEMPDYTSGSAPWAAYAEQVKTIYIDPRITSIGDYAFENCSNLTFVDYGYSVASVGEYAFAGCSSLTSFQLPDSVTTISEGAFSGCTGLKAVVIPDNITSVGDNAFYGCTELIQATVGGEVTDIGNDAFSNCGKLTQIYFRGEPVALGSNALGSTNGKYIYYYSTVSGWSDEIVDGLWNGYIAVPYNAISKENFNGTNIYIIKVVDKYNTPLENAVVNLGGNVQSTNEDGMAYYVKPTTSQSLSVSCSNHIGFTDSSFKATTTQIMDVIELSDRPSVVQGVRLNNESIATSVGVINCSSDETVDIVVGGYSKYVILKYELYQGNRLIASRNTQATSCTFSVKANAFEEEETVLVKMYTSDGYMVASALKIDVIKLASISEQQILDELSQIELSFSLGSMGNYKVPLSFEATGEEKFYTTINDRTIRVGINLDIGEFFEKEGENASKSKLQKMVDKSMKNFAKGKAGFEYNVCGYIEIEYLGNGEYYVKTSYVKIGVAAKLSFNAQASYLGIVGVYFKASLSGESTLDMHITRYVPEEGFYIDDLNFAIENTLSVEGGAYLLWGIGSAGIYGKTKMGFVLGIIPDLEFESVYISGEMGVKWSLLWGLWGGKYTFLSGDIYRWPEAQTYMMRALAMSLYEAQQDPDSYTLNDRAYLENRSEWLAGTQDGDYLQQNIYGNVAPKIVTCGDTTVMVWLDDNSQRDNANYQTLYYSVYKNGIWSEPVPVDDNGTFDCEFDLYTDGDKIYVIYTEMKNQNTDIEALDVSNQSDIDAFVNNVEVAVAVFENGTFSEPIRLTDNSVCEVLPSLTSSNGALTAVWLQTNSVGLTTEDSNNTVYRAVLNDNGWSEPLRYIDGQNSISDITTVCLKNASYTAYIVDADGSSETKDDKILVLTDQNGDAVQLDTGLIANIGYASVNGTSALTWHNNGKIYMITEPGQQPICLVPENVSVGANYQIVSISEEQTLLSFVMSNYDSSGNSSDGTDIYSVYIDSNGCLTSAIRLTETEGYVDNYSISYRDEKLVIVFTETFADISGESVETVTHLRNEELDFYTDITLNGVDYDITTAQNNTALDITLCVTNNGTNNIDGMTVNFYNEVGQLLYTTDCEIVLESGASTDCTVAVILPQSITTETYVIEILPKNGMAETTDLDFNDNRAEFSLAYTDMTVEAEQKIIGEKNYIILSVSNMGNVASEAKIEIYAPDQAGRQIASIETGAIESGVTEQYFVDINALTSTEDSIVTCVVSSELVDPYSLNNTATVSLLHINDESFVTDPEQVMHNPEISVNTAKFDKYTPQDIILEITAETDSFSTIEGLILNTDYTVVDGVVTINSTYLATLKEGVHTLDFVFDFGYDTPTVRTLSITVCDSTPVILTGSIDISGETTVGNTVYADLSEVEPSTSSVVYNWTIDGVTVSTQNNYTITSQDYGKILNLTVTGANGFEGTFTAESIITLSKPSAPTAPVISMIGITSVAVAKTTGVEYSLDLVTWQDSNVFNNLLPNETYTVYARNKATDTSEASDASATFFTTEDRTAISGTVTIQGEPQFGETLTVDLSDFVGDIESISYQWFSDGVAIADATQSTYTVTESDMGKTIDVRVMGTDAYKGELTATLDIRDFVMGDVDGNNVVNNFDRLVLTRYLAQWEDYPEDMVDMVAADVNQDGSVNNFDRLILTRYLADWEGYEVLPYKDVQGDN